MIHNDDAKCPLMLLAADWERHHRNLNPKRTQGSLGRPKSANKKHHGFPQIPIVDLF